MFISSYELRQSCMCAHSLSRLSVSLPGDRQYGEPSERGANREARFGTIL